MAGAFGSTHVWSLLPTIDMSAVLFGLLACGLGEQSTYVYVMYAPPPDPPTQTHPWVGLCPL